ncbi:glucosaminidase domain-containing protein [Clostridium sp. YIM B02506]|uniref:glycoside hydrolase family 73 protein n=1 Tax=Clostridium sp. YIM B02506 TaxID=2910680 RepID=UPI001EEE5C7B|nr:glucosaminidase domain-containing protein [Clostridium sp. YIM B02506]
MKKGRGLKILATLMVIMLIGALGSVYALKKYNRYKLEQARLKNIAITKDIIRLYVDEADKMGVEKIQLNWKELAAISAVKANNYIVNVDENEIENIAESFIIEKQSGGKTYYGSKDMLEVAADLKFDDKQTSRVTSYYEQLDDLGLYSENLKKDSPQRKFVESVKPYAIEVYEKYGILPSIVVAQAFYESHWGESVLSQQAKNYFGIKADTSWKGKTVTMETTEFHNEKIKDKFRLYDTVSESFDDYGNFLTTHPRYRQAGVFEAKDYEAMAKALEKGGYSTAQNAKGEKVYAIDIYSIVRANDLMILDSLVLKNKFNKQFGNS